MRDRQDVRDRVGRAARRLRRRAGRLRRRLGRLLSRPGRIPRTVRRRLEETRTLVHVSILLFVPFMVALLTYLSGRIDQLSFFLFPPLAAGTYALFSNPESEYASPTRFVAGLTTGAVCAWIAMTIAVRFVYPGLPPTAIEVDAPGAAFAVFLTGAVTWALDVEEAAAFSMALLGLLVDPGDQPSFVVSVVLASSIVAGVFAVWRDLFYEQRAQYLYQSIKGDDHVLVPMRGETPEATAMLGGRLAAAHDAGKVVLLDVVEEDGSDDGGETTVDAESVDAESVDAATDVPTDETVAATASELETIAADVEATLEVPCQVVVAATDGSVAATVRRTARETNCDLIATPYETGPDGDLTRFVTQLLDARMDVLVHKSHDGRTAWRRVVVPVRSASDTAHAMIDFALRLVGSEGRVAVARCIDSDRERRQATEMLANLVETADGRIETRVDKAPIEQFVRRLARTNDLVIVGASRDRSRASRLLSPPTFERIDDIETDIAIVDRRR